MKKFAIILMVLMVAGTAWALDDIDHVIQAPNFKGDVLIFPHFVAVADGWETKLTIINTAEDRSVVAKLIVRSAGYSIELRDFLIYLSPADVWTGKIYFDATDGPSIMSTDDSALAAAGQFASPQNPLQINLEKFCDVNDIGYVTVIEAWSSSDPAYPCSLGPEDLGSSTAPVEKQCIFEAYNNDFASTNEGTRNVLYGTYQLSLNGVFVGGDNANHLADYDNLAELLPQNVTLLGEGALNNRCEIEAALNKNFLAMPYVDDAANVAVHWVTYPTKLSDVDVVTCEYPLLPTRGVRGEYVGWENPPQTIDLWSDVYGLKFWDLSETTPQSVDPIFSPTPPSEVKEFPFEVNFLFSSAVSGLYEEGWIRYQLQDVSTLDETNCFPFVGSADVINYTGAPVIGLFWQFGPNGLSIAQAASTNGVVRYNGAPMDFYQYANGFGMPMGDQ